MQRAVRDAFEDVTGEQSPGWGIDGCSAPNHACTLAGLARAMARFVAAGATGAGRACTELMRAATGRLAAKTGAEGVYAAIQPDSGLGVALKIADGSIRAAEGSIRAADAALVALLAHPGGIGATHPAARRRLGRTLRNWRGLPVGRLQTVPGFPDRQVIAWPRDRF